MWRGRAIVICEIVCTFEKWVVVDSDDGNDSFILCDSISFRVHSSFLDLMATHP